MKLTIHIVGLVASLAFSIGPVHAGDEHCDCTIFPFQPDPPCFDTCVPKHMAIAREADLENVFALPGPVALTVSNIKPSDRPRRLKDYDYLILGYAIERDKTLVLSDPKLVYAQFEKTVHSLKAEDFARVRKNAIEGWSIDKLDWSSAQ